VKVRAPRALARIAAGATLLLVGCGGQAAPAASAPPATAAAKTSAAPAQSAKPAAPASGSLKPIKIGFSQSAVPFTPFFMGKEAGFYAKYGLDVTLQQVNGPAAVPALLADELQFDGLGANELTRAVISGAPVTSVATLGDVPVFVLMADKKYKSVEDLAGQSVGVTAVGTSTYLAAQLFLDHYKMLDKVKIAPAGGTTATVYAALTQGVVQAAIMGSDQAARAAKEGFVELVDGLKLGVPMNFSLVAVKRSYAKDNPEIVKSFLRAHQDSWNYVADPANKSAIIPVITRYIQATPEIAEAGYTPWLTVWQSKKVPTIDPQGITNTLRFSDDPKARSAKPEEFVDDSFLKSIQQA
jgi:ABC-type nitrate/sulfonate/bicarbonate transport system substrate-binding protein